MPDKPNILIVDDRQENLIALESLLEECDAHIHRALSGNEALTLMLKHPFALVLLDVQMPGMDGFEVAELMRVNTQTQTIPIIFVTAISKEQQYVFKGYESGAVDYLTKPVEPIVLLSKVRIFIQLWKQNQALAEALQQKDILAEKLRQQAEYDALTGLPNRALFHDRLKQAVLLCERNKNVGALLFIDLDRFKWVNDTLGHKAGDQLLIDVSQRLCHCVRRTDTVSRLGGDEFTVVIQNVPHESFVEMISRKILDELARPFQLGKKEVQISGSVGVTIFPHDSVVLEDLLKNADTAMYKAKDSGRNAFCFFTSEMNDHAVRRMVLEEQLRVALEEEEFCLHYQPKVDLKTGHIIGMEALIRWERHDGMVFPDEFIPLAEEIGLIVPLGKWVMKAAALQNKAWHSAGLPLLTMGINLSAKQLNDQDDLIKTVDDILAATGLPPESLELEITETTVMENLDVGLKTLQALKDRGIQVSVDDFGTGYSSLGSLKSFPIQTLKIDKSFVRDLSLDSDDAAIVSAIISMAGKLSLKVIAEGVENQEQLDFLKQDGCDAIQGYFFSRPVSAQACTQMLQEKKALVFSS
ncbi:MAG: EAL domain-containing protein [Magnetococcales bacterium]|nr:EAL domain-containing protein [Magnetococcales bacterium]